jgi:hypothetical protein
MNSLNFNISAAPPPHAKDPSCHRQGAVYKAQHKYKNNYK